MTNIRVYLTVIAIQCVYNWYICSKLIVFHVSVLRTKN